MVKQTPKYYLQVGDKIIDFNGIYGLQGIDDFLSLSLFTGQFKDSSSLKKVLIQLKMIKEEDMNEQITIAKRKGNKKEGYRFSFATSDILYREGLRILSPQSLTDILSKNYENYDFIHEIMNHYILDLEELISIFYKKVEQLENELKYAAKESRQDILEELKKRENTLKNFNRQKSNIMRINRLATAIEKNSWFEHDYIKEYITRLSMFVMEEISYKNGKNTVPNYRGQVKLASRLSHIYPKYSKLFVPFSTKYEEKSNEIKALTEQAISISNTVNKPRNTSNDTEEEPDNYMFLEEVDYLSLLSEKSSTEQESIDIGIETLIEKKAKF